MNDIMMMQKYPAQGIQKMEFRFDPLTEDFDMAGIVFMPDLNLMASDFQLMYQGGIESTYPDGTPRHPNEPFFMLDIDDKRLLNVPLCRIPCSLYDGINIKKGIRIDAFIEYPLHAVPLSRDSGFTVILVRKD